MLLHEITDTKIKAKRVFLGGTCNDSKWRDDLIPLLKIDYFNPVVDDWTEECQIEEIKQRQECDYVLYVITNKMTGAFSIAEVTDDSNKRPDKTIFCILEDYDGTFSKGPLKSLMRVQELVESNGAKVANSLIELADILNS
jgi:hypothetical protein